MPHGCRKHFFLCHAEGLLSKAGTLTGWVLPPLLLLLNQELCRVFPELLSGLANFGSIPSLKYTYSFKCPGSFKKYPSLPGDMSD